jgi:uncharacterized protein with PIN domain
MKFILTYELGRLSKWLRILGFDTIIEEDKRRLVIKSLREDRIILTRDSKMSRFTGTRIVKVKSDFIEEQLAQIMRELDLSIDINNIFKLCVLCNTRLEEIDKASVRERVPKYVFDTQRIFLRCPKCDKIYWQGTHWELVGKFLSRLKA